MVSLATAPLKCFSGQSQQIRAREKMDACDEVVVHYAVKTLENIMTQSPIVAQKWFLTTNGKVLAESLNLLTINGVHGQTTTRYSVDGV